MTMDFKFDVDTIQYRSFISDGIDILSDLGTKYLWIQYAEIIRCC